MVFTALPTSWTEESNPPCVDIADQVAAAHTTRTGGPVAGKMFPKYAVGMRGVVGVVDVAGRIEPGDRVVVEVKAR